MRFYTEVIGLKVQSRTEIEGVHEACSPPTRAAAGCSSPSATTAARPIDHGFALWKIYFNVDDCATCTTGPSPPAARRRWSRQLDRWPVIVGVLPRPRRLQRRAPRNGSTRSKPAHRRSDPDDRPQHRRCPPAHCGCHCRCCRCLIELHGIDALTMRRLSDELGVAVTSIYWHVGNAPAALRRARAAPRRHGRGPCPGARAPDASRRSRTTCAAKLLERPRLVALAHEQGETRRCSSRCRRRIVAELAQLGLRGDVAALTLARCSCMSSLGPARAHTRAQPARTGRRETAPWLRDNDDDELVDALGNDADRVELFNSATGDPARPRCRAV